MTPELGPESLSTKGIPSVRRGYDRKMVDQVMSEAAAAWTELSAEHQKLLDVIDEAGGLEFLSADLAALAEDVGRMLAEAQTAAAGIRERAAADAVEQTRRSSEAARRIRTEAEQTAFTIRRQAWETGTALLEQALGTAAVMLEQADADVLIIRAEAEQEAHRRVAAARREASDIVRNARFEADRLVTEAKALAQELISRAQQEADAAQERAKALEGRRRRLLEEIDEREGTLGSGIRVISSEGSGSEPASAGPRPHLLGDDLASEVERLQGEARREAMHERVRSVSEPGDETGFAVTGEPTWGEPVDSAEEESTELQPDVGTDADSEPEADGMVEAGQEPEGAAPDREVEAQPEADEEAAADDAGGPVPETVEFPPQETSAARPGVTDLFARLRGVPAEGQEGNQAAGAPQRDALEIRDRLLLPIQNEGLREVKQRIVEAQNIALDALRVAGEWSPDDRAFADALAGALDETVERAAGAGSAAAGEMLGIEPPGPVITNRSGSLARAMAEDLGSRVRQALAESVGTGTREVLATTSRAFRGWRAEDAERWVGAVVSTAYHDSLLGGLAALGVERVEGVRNGRICDQCPAALGGVWHPAEGPPAGALLPPAGIDCRCTVSPAG